MISTISKNFIESIALADSSDFNEKTEQTVYNLVSLAMEDMQKTIPYVSVKYMTMAQRMGK